MIIITGRQYFAEQESAVLVSHLLQSVSCLHQQGLHHGVRVSAEATFGRGDLSVCPLGGFPGAHAHLTSNWRGVPKGSHLNTKGTSPWGHFCASLMLDPMRASCWISAGH